MVMMAQAGKSLKTDTKSIFDNHTDRGAEGAIGRERKGKMDVRKIENRPGEHHL